MAAGRCCVMSAFHPFQTLGRRANLQRRQQWIDRLLSAESPLALFGNLTRRTGKAFIGGHGVLRLPHEATCRTIASLNEKGARMSTLNAISPDKLLRLIGTPACPAIVDLRRSSGTIIPASHTLDPDAVDRWASLLHGLAAVIVCDDGKRFSPGVAAWLRHRDVDAEVLEGGLEAWQAAGLPLVDSTKLPERDADGRTTWVTRARPKVDRIACPWLIRRFVDPRAVFLFVAPSEVEPVAVQFDAAPFDYEGVFWSHRGEQCTFDTMVDELGLVGFEALQQLRVIVRGADTVRPELAPQC